MLYHIIYIIYYLENCRRKIWNGNVKQIILYGIDEAGNGNLEGINGFPHDFVAQMSKPDFEVPAERVKNNQHTNDDLFFLLKNLLILEIKNIYLGQLGHTNCRGRKEHVSFLSSGRSHGQGQGCVLDHQKDKGNIFHFPVFL